MFETYNQASSRIRSQCAALVAALMKCSPHYVRCIKSNDQRQPLRIDSERVKHQVKYLGLVENIKVRRAGFAYRAEYHRFLDRRAIFFLLLLLFFNKLIKNFSVVGLEFYRRLHILSFEELTKMDVKPL